MLRCLTPLLALAALATTLANGGDVASAQAGSPASGVVEDAGVKMPAGPMLQQPIGADPQEAAAVPEPVLTSILAASAVIFLRRTRR